MKARCIAGSRGTGMRGEFFSTLLTLMGRKVQPDSILDNYHFKLLTSLGRACSLSYSATILSRSTYPSTHQVNWSRH